MLRSAFLPLAAEYLTLLHRWLQQPHVREFWDDGDRTLEQVRAHYFAPERDVLAFIFMLDGQPAGYVQAYPVTTEGDYTGWRSETGETWGIDLFIGEEKWLGRGVAVFVIRAVLAHLQGLRPALRRVLIDPEERNTRARHVYARAGFTELGRVELDGKRLVVMRLDVNGDELP
ncbi:GNAT family N-acetyltransferase [Deinococcus wulumuqiensis]|uniref:GNAT family N-acetyltransferase n=1 Tax=Deinococcus wulumuqiensis TaxID=980427 RepID=UPI002430D877|nr:GNAT family N-acetyltransferase [Deinococcus wulumuqiensis]